MVEQKSQKGANNYLVFVSDEAQLLAEENGVRLVTGSEFARSLLDVGFGSFDI